MWRSISEVRRSAIRARVSRISQPSSSRSCHSVSVETAEPAVEVREGGVFGVDLDLGQHADDLARIADSACNVFSSACST